MELEVTTLAEFEKELKPGADVRLEVVEGPVMQDIIGISLLITANNGGVVLKCVEEMGLIKNDEQGNKTVQTRISTIANEITAHQGNFTVGGVWKG